MSNMINLISFLIQLNEKLIFYPKLYFYYKKSFKQKNIDFLIDVGVNKGQSIDFFKKLNPLIKGVGFEPHKSLYKNLIENKSFKNFKFYNKGCSDRNGNLIFKENILDESSTFEIVNENSMWLKKKKRILGFKDKNLTIKEYNVDTVRLNDFINENLEETIIDLIKIDVEGHEINVIKGLFPIRPEYKIRYIQIENHKDDLYLRKNSLRQIEDILIKNGFIRDTTINHGFGKIEEVIYKNLSFEY